MIKSNSLAERMAKRYAELKSQKTTRICAVCKNPFAPIPRHPTQIYCSVECRSEMAKIKYAQTKILKTCDRCGKEFRGSPNALYCSDRCRHPGKYKEIKIQKPATAPTVRGQMMVGIIPKTHGWNGPCGRELERPKTAPRAILKCDPSKLPYRGEPTRQYSGPDPKVREYKAALEANKTWHLKF